MTIVLFSDENLSSRKFYECLRLLEEVIKDFRFHTVFVTNIENNLKNLEKYAEGNDFSLIIEKPAKRLLSAGWFYSTPNMLDKYLKDNIGFVVYFFNGNVDRLISLRRLTKAKNMHFICISAENNVFRMLNEDIDLTLSYGFKNTF